MSKFEQKAIDHNHNTVKSWLIEQGFSLEDKPEAGTLWHVYAFEQGGKFGFGIAQLSNYPHLITVSVNFSFGYFQPYLDKLPAQERADVLLELWFVLLNFDLEFRAHGDPFNAIEMVSHVYVDELRRSVFWRAVRTLRKGFMAGQWILERKFKTPFSNPLIDASSAVM